MGTTVSTMPRAPDDQALVRLADVFDRYRRHYHQAPDPDRTVDWLRQVLADQRLVVFTAQRDGALVGFATTLEAPASLRLAVSWQLRDLYVDPAARRRGVGAALLAATREAAVAAGAIHLSLQTERDNDPALAFYARGGFVPAHDLHTLVLPLTDEPAG